MIKRKLASLIKRSLKQIPIVMITGPRQSGKTTLAKAIAPKYKYVNLEFPDQREHAETDPRDFLGLLSEGAILDEVQHVPALFSYIQGVVDEKGTNGQFILTGSQNFNLLEKITQSLAGRTNIFNLLPLSIDELKQSNLLPAAYEDLLVRGFYPRLYDQKIDQQTWMISYIQSYIQRDVRQIVNVKDLNSFNLFIKICAGRVGQLVNMNSISNEVGVDLKTIKSWLSILETSFIIFFLQPHHRNFNKRLVKSPKLYFHDVGVATSLLGIDNAAQVVTHYLKGGLFENMVVSEILKQRFNAGKLGNLYFWKDNTGNEIDCLLESPGDVTALEIKSGKTLTSDFFKNLKYYRKLNEQSKQKLVYGGDQSQNREGIKVYSWKNFKLD